MVIDTEELEDIIQRLRNLVDHDRASDDREGIPYSLELKEAIEALEYLDWTAVRNT